MTAPETVRITEVRTSTKNLTVSTIKIGFRHYDTVILDNHDDKRHSGKILPAHEAEGRRHGPWVIDKLNIRADTREEAMDDHREALYAARVEEIR